MKKTLALLLAALLLLCCCTTNEAIPGIKESLRHKDAKVVFYGDSRIFLASWYKAFPNTSVVNLGIGGDRISNLMQRLPLFENHKNVETIVLSIGGNDCIVHHNDFDEEDFERQYEELLCELEKIAPNVILNTITGVCLGTASTDQDLVIRVNKNMAKANEIIMDIAKMHGLTVIDIAKLMNNEDGSMKAQYSSDGLHFTDLGNQIWYEELRPYIE